MVCSLICYLTKTVPRPFKLPLSEIDGEWFGDVMQIFACRPGVVSPASIRRATPCYPACWRADTQAAPAEGRPVDRGGRVPAAAP